MKTPRIVTALFCVVAIVAMYGCGGSSQLSESPSALDEFMGAANVHFTATGLGGGSTSSADASKAFFADDAFEATGTYPADALAGSVTMECWFDDGPHVKDMDGAGPFGTVDITLAANVDACDGLRNCCVINSSDRGEACTINIACILDPDATDLANTGIETDFFLYQHMETNMRDDSGVIATAIENLSDSGDVDVHVDMSSISVTRNSAGGQPCYTYAGAEDNKFTVVDDTSTPLWAAEDATANDGDIMGETDYAWNVDYVGEVELTAPDEFAVCEISYADITAAVSFFDLSEGAQSVSKTLTISGKGRICNSQDYGECEGDAMWEFVDEPF